MARLWVPTGPQQLLERERELAEIDELVDAALAEEGSFLVLEGRSGIGKSALLAELRRRAAAAGLETCYARGSELEREFAFGVVRQLLEPAVRALSPGDRAQAFEGASALAEPVLDLGGEPAAGGQFAALHGLYWLTANLSASRPMLLAVDDAHWADVPSLRWLAYLLNRLEGVPVLVAIATRPPRPERDGEFLDAIMAHPEVRVLSVDPLREGSVASLVRTALNAEPAPTFTAACLRATAGNPLGLRELLRELRISGIAPSKAAASDLETTAPDAIRRRVLRDVRLLGDEAGRVARALAVMGDGTELRLIARLADLGVDRAAEAADDLERADLVVAERPPHFAHPLLRAAVYDRLPAGTRQKLHRQAAEILASEGEEPETVAAHLLRCEPDRNLETIRWLREAAPPARRRGAPEAAISYLRRGLAEDMDIATRSTILADLAAAELQAGNLEASAHFREAVTGMDDPRDRAAALAGLALAVILENDEGASLDIFKRALEELRSCDPDASAGLECIVTGLSFADPEVAPHLDRQYQRLAELAQGPTPTAELARATLASLLSWRDGNRQEALSWVRGGFDWTVLVGGPYLQAFGVLWAVLALLGIDDLPRATDWCETVIRESAGRGNPLVMVTGMVFKTYAEGRMGLLAEAEADVTAAFQASKEQFPFWAPVAGAYLAEILFERGRQQEAFDAIEGLGSGITGPLRETIVQQVRGRLRWARGARQQGVDDLRGAGARCEALRLSNPIIWPWRASLAAALAGDSPEEARQLAQEDLLTARRSGIPRAIGVALRTLAGLDHDDSIDLLRAAVVELEKSPATLELGRTLADLGAALRRSGHKVEARKPLREALEVAAHCGALPLMERVRTEALSAGARPRSPHLRGIYALTPSELRVARLAAGGRSNREIAQELFITVKTVGDHLGASYSKLDITSRSQLTAALELATA